jgi:hypothetical protein
MATRPKVDEPSGDKHEAKSAVKPAAKPSTHCEIAFPKVLSFTTSTAPDNLRDDVRFVFEAHGVNRGDAAEVGDICHQLDRCVQEFKETVLSRDRDSAAK